jgi:hypothetical protein
MMACGGLIRSVDKPGVTRQRQAIFNTYNHYLGEIGLGSTCSSVINVWNNRSRWNEKLTEIPCETCLQKNMVEMLTLFETVKCRMRFWLQTGNSNWGFFIFLSSSQENPWYYIKTGSISYSPSTKLVLGFNTVMITCLYNTLLYIFC